MWAGREAVEGVLAAYLRNIPFMSADAVFKQGIDIPEEFIAGSRVREEAGTLVDKHTEISAKLKLTYDLFPLFLVSALNALTRTQHAGAPTVAAVQTITFATFTNLDTFKLTYDQYITPAIVWSSTPATTATNIQTALRALPSINGANVTVAGTGPFTITFGGNMANVAVLPITYSAISGSGTIAIAQTTAGVGALDYAGKIGSGVPALSIIIYDGVEYRQYLGCSVDQAKFMFMQNKSPEVDLKIIGRGETTLTSGQVAAMVLPVLQRASYSKVAAQDLAVTINGVSFTALLTGTIDLKLNRKPLNTIQPGLDMTRATEGKIEADYELDAVFTAQTGSLYEKYVNNTPIGTVAITAQRLASNIGVQPVNTTIALAVTAGAGVVVTPASMANIIVGSQLTCDNAGGGASEVVTVTAVTGTTFTATFASNKTINSTVKLTATNPTFQMSLPNPIVKEGNIKAMGQDYTSQIVKGRGGLDIPTATNISTLVTNEVANYLGS
jgi:hypothetical protein